MTIAPDTYDDTGLRTELKTARRWHGARPTKERPDAVLPTLGGQTALNTAVAVAEMGILEKYGVELIGAKLPDGVKTDGLSMLGILRGGAAPQRTCFYWELHEGRSQQAVRFGDWKAVKNGPQFLPCALQTGD